MSDEENKRLTGDEEEMRHNEVAAEDAESTPGDHEDDKVLTPEKKKEVDEDGAVEFPTEGNTDTAGSLPRGENQQRREGREGEEEEESDSGFGRRDTFAKTATVGGLLTASGEDIRKSQEVDPQDDANLRRKGMWRGISNSADAVLQWDFAVETFDYKIQAMVLGADLRIYLLFIVAFCFFFLTGRNINQNHYFSKAVKDPLVGSEIAQLKVAKFFDDISEASEFNLYVLDVIQIQLIDLEYPTGGNIFTGGMRFRTQRVKRDSCDINPAIIPPSMPTQAQECYGSWSDKNGDDGTEMNRYNGVTRWKYTSCADMGGGQALTGIIDRYNCGGYSFTVPWWRPATSSASLEMPFPSAKYERLPKDVAENFYIKPALMSSPPFVDNLATRFVVAEFFLYNPTLETFLGVKMYCEQASGGLWVPDYQYRVFSVYSNDDLAKGIYDIFFYCFVIYYIFHFIGDVRRFYKREKKILAFFFNTWNLLELINLSIFLTVGVFRIMWVDKSLSANVRIEEIVYGEKFPVELDDIALVYMFQVYLNSVNTVLTFLKLLKFFRLNDRLNILTRTLSESQDSIIGVLFIFLLVVTAFAMTGHGLFGLGVWRFRSVDASFSTLLQMLLGVFDYEEMKNENRVQAGFFFWSYIILALFCLLNFLIGVLMEAFAEVSSTKPVLPLESILAKTFSDWKRLLNPANLWKSFKASLTQTSREVLLTDAVQQLGDYRAIKFPEDEDFGVDKHMMTLDDFESAIDEDIAEKVGKEYMAYIWDDIVYEWDMSKEAQEAIDSHRNLLMTTKGVKNAIGSHLERIEGFSGRMSDLEQQLTKLVELLDGTHVAS